MRKAILNIAGSVIVMKVEGDTVFGENKVLLLEDDDLTKTTSWHKDGYTIAPFLSEELFKQLVIGITDKVRLFIEKEVGRPLTNFTLSKYHEVCSSNDLHLAVIKHLQQCFRMNELPVNYRLLEERVSALCGIKLACHPKNLPDNARFCIRIVRPQRDTDNNPPHRDVWLDRLRNAINIYLPLAGSNQHSSLPLIPSSHLWKESSIERTTSGSRVNNVAFTVPCVVASEFGLEMIRPSVKPNEVMVFSPYLIHGGGCNLNHDETRVSVEIRFWRDLD